MSLKISYLSYEPVGIHSGQEIHWPSLDLSISLPGAQPLKKPLTHTVTVIGHVAPSLIGL